MNEDRDTIAATKLTRTEFAVVRAYAQGMRPVDIANRYLLDPDDDDALTEAQAITRILSLRDRLVQFALQHDRPDIAEMFEALRGRSDVGMTRRVDALSSLEQLGQGRPLESHEVSLWFGPSLARRLTAAGIAKIADLTALANRRGSSWWRAVPRLGPKSADIITRWLIRQGATDGNRPGRWVRPYVTPPLEPAARGPLRAIPLGRGMPYPVPLEYLALHQNHDHGSQIDRDLVWVRQWLAQDNRASHTVKSYRREAERLLLWTAQQGSTLGALDAKGLERYLEFLRAPEPAAFWCGPASPRDREHWRPFEGPLSAASQEAALRVVRALLRAAYKGGHIVGKSDGVLRDRSPTVRGDGVREAPQAPTGLDASDIAAFLAWLGDQPGDRRHVAYVASHLMRHGMTIGDIAGLRCADVEWLTGGTARLTLARSGRTMLALPPLVGSALRDHWIGRGVSREATPDAALLGPIALPPTTRAAARHGDGTLTGYSPSGLDQLLRAAWKDYVRAMGLTLSPFTPKLLRLCRLPADAVGAPPQEGVA